MYLSEIIVTEVFNTVIKEINKAFDLMRHNLLFDKLYRFGVQGVALDWISSLLHTFVEL